MTNPLTLDKLQAALRTHPNRNVAVILPDGRAIPAGFHVTEAGTVTKDFIDCGGTRRRRVTAQLQTWQGRDSDHRLTTDRLARILEVCEPVLPAGDTPVEVEYEDTVTSQYPLGAIEADDSVLRLHLGLRHTDCLAKSTCGQPEEEPAGAAAGAGRGCGCGPDCC